MKITNFLFAAIAALFFIASCSTTTVDEVQNEVQTESIGSDPFSGADCECIDGEEWCTESDGNGGVKYYPNGRC